jgi:SSS family transporter
MIKDVTSIDYWVLIFYIFLILGIGIYFSKFMKGAKQYFTGGNMIPWWVSGISLYMSSFSAWTFTGASGFVYHSGAFGLVYFLTWSFAYFVGYRLTAARWRRSRVISPTQYTSTRYNVTTQQLVSYVVVVSGMLARGLTLTAVSKIISFTLNINLDIVIIVAGLAILAYTFLGGLWAVTITDVVQFIILFVITLLVMPLSLSLIGGFDSFVQNLPPLKLNHVFNNMHYDIHYLIAFTFINMIAGANFNAAQRYYSVKDEKSAKRVGLTCSLLFLTVPLLFGIPPIVAKMLWPDLSALPSFAGTLIPEDLVYISIVLKVIPNGLIGFFLAAMFAATMSTIDTTFNVESSIISKDLYGNWINRDATDKQILKVGKIATLFLGVFTIATALYYARSKLGIFNLMVTFTSLLHMPVAIPMVFGLVFKRLPRWSAVSAILLGLLMSVVAKFLLSYTVGPHVYVTIAITFIVLIAAGPLGRLYKRDHLLLLAIVLFSTLILFTSLYFTASWASDLHIVLYVISAFLFAAGLLFFVRLFSLETPEDKMIVEKFFVKLLKPVDVIREVYGAGKKQMSTFPVVGIITFAIGIFVLFLLLTSLTPKESRIIAISGFMLVVIGFSLAYFGNKSEKKFNQKLEKWEGEFK